MFAGCFFAPAAPDRASIVCEESADCPSGRVCADGRCFLEQSPCVQAGALLPDGATCTLNDGDDGVCTDGACVESRCGDLFIGRDEACDDGNASGGDGCSAACMVEAGYTCTGQPSTCGLTCGDGAIDGTEACDDGNRESDDGCSSTCVREDGFRCPTPGDTCDAVCGDGLIVGDEPCDDTNTTNGDGCTSACVVETGFTCTGAPSDCVRTCGDGLLTNSEACDDGNFDDGDGCSAGCAIEAGFDCPSVGAGCTTVCGDGLLRLNELCDDGDLEDGDGCDSACAPEAAFTCYLEGDISLCDPCGNGTVVDGESCDDGDLQVGDGCDDLCAPEAGFVCTGSPSDCRETCGNSVLDPGETCDDGNRLNDGCSSNCNVQAGFACRDAGQLCVPVCGDGLVVPAEDCDDDNLIGGDGCDATCAVEAGFFCEGSPSSCGPGCMLSGAPFRPGERNPDNLCASCEVTADGSSFVAVPDNTECSDGIFCNGAELCQAGLCRISPSPCQGPTPSCDETDARCLCDDTSCNDSLFCNGTESCVDGACTVPQATFCPTGDQCSEDAQACVKCLQTSDCDNGESCLDGDCVPGGCPTGQVQAFVDADGDGFGAGAPLNNCVDEQNPPTGFASNGTDCDDDNVQLFVLQELFPDGDGDGVTLAGITVCIGASVPEGFATAERGPPAVRYNAKNVNAGQEWVHKENITVRGPLGEFDAGGNGARLTLTDWSFAIEASAEIVGIRVNITKRGNAGSRDNILQLMFEGAEIGESKDDGLPWSQTLTTVSYGGPQDLWGATETIRPDLVNRDTFGLLFNPVGNGEVDTITMEVFIKSPAFKPDCDDGDPRSFFATKMSADLDQDGFTTSDDVQACGGQTPPLGAQFGLGLGLDCYDENAGAFPGNPDYFTVERGDGSFDYNCDEQQQQLKLDSDTVCACEVGDQTCFAIQSEMVGQIVRCGGDLTVMRCAGACPCNPQPTTEQQPCR